MVTEIDFDTGSSGTVIDTEYTQYGVTFSSVLAPTSTVGHVCASNRVDGAETPPNVVTLSPPPHQADFNDYSAPGLNLPGGLIRAEFSEPVQYVSIDVFPFFSAADRTGSGNNRPFLKMYGLAVHLPGGRQLPPPLIATVWSPLDNSDPNFQTWQRMSYLSIEASPNIGSVEFSCSYTGEPSVYAVFDRLRFAHGPPSANAILLTG